MTTDSGYTSWLDDGDVRLYEGDCIEVMRALPAESIDAIITDPPYGIGFMGKAWDSFEKPGGDERSWAAMGGPTGKDNTKHSLRGGAMHAGKYDLSLTANRRYQAWCEEWALECFRLLKPGGHLAAFCGTRTTHRLAAGIEDAGFEIRDTLAWLYGSGFPKSLDVSKAIDRAAGAERVVVGRYELPDVADGRRAKGWECSNTTAPGVFGVSGQSAITVAATPDAETWQGWGTALKPAHEPITLARKPLAGTVAANVLKHSTGALNIDACRIETDAPLGRFNHAKPAEHRVPDSHPDAKNLGRMQAEDALIDNSRGLGRWPANVVLDPEAAAMLDEQSGITSEPAGRALKRGGGKRATGWGLDQTSGGIVPGGTGGASRFFYTAKAAASERTEPGGVKNTHPTVKPVDLMRWLIRLLAPPGALILDPFAGSGTTGVAARAEHVRCILIEREAEYLPIIAGRLSQQALF